MPSTLMGLIINYEWVKYPVDVKGPWALQALFFRIANPEKRRNSKNM
jgi:hypothetical protein